MKTVIVGCGRVGSVLADAFDQAGHQVIILDLQTTAFDRLPGTFSGEAVRGDGTDEDTLRRAGAESADLFMAMTEGDNRNVMSAQLATEALHAKQVIAKINDPLRASAYAELGLATLCRTNLMASAVSTFLGFDLTFGPGLTAATGHHPGGEHHGPSDDVAPGAATLPGSSAPTNQVSTTLVPTDQTSTPAPDEPPTYASSPAGSASASSDPNPAPVAPISAREG